MENKETFLQLHKRILLIGHIPGENGLCSVWHNGKYLEDNDIFRRTFPVDYNEHSRNAYWGDDENPNDPLGYHYTDIRQNIILLCAAINDEL